MNEKIIKIVSFFRKQTNWIYPISLLLFCFIIWGVPGHGLLYFGDVQASYIFYPDKVYGTLNIWGDLYNSGTANYGIFQNYIFSLFVIVSHYIFTLDLHSYVYSFLGFYLFSLSFYFLYKKIFKDNFVAFLIGIFTLVSPITYTYHSGILLIYSIAFINFSLIWLHPIFYFEKKNGVMWKQIIFVSIFLTLADVYLQNFFFYLYIIPFFVLFNLKYIFQHKVFLFKNFLAIVLCYILLNIFWIYILIYQILSSSGNFFETAIQITASMDVANLITKLTDVVNFYRLVPYYFSSGGDALAYYNSNIILLFSSYVVAIAAFSSVYINKERKYRKGILFSMLLFIVTFPILNGNKAPFENFFLLFWNHVPLAQTFRTFTKLMFIDLYAIAYLLGVFFIYLFTRTNKWYVKIISIILIAFPIIIYNTPLMRNKSLLQEKIPDYYSEMKDKFVQPLNANTMMAPQTNWLVTYKWRTKEKDTDNIFPFFYNGRVFTNGASYTQDQEWQNYNNLTASFIINQYFDKLGYLFSYKNVGFLSLQDDIDSFLDFKDGSRITTESNIKGGGIFFKKIANYGDIYIYETPDKYFNQQIFSPNEIYSIKRNSVRNTNLAASSPFIISSLLTNSIKTTDAGFIFEEQNKDNLDLPAEDFKKILFDYKGSLSLDYASPTDSPKIQAVSKELSEGNKTATYEAFDIKKTLLNKADIEFKKISSIQYEVYVHNAKQGKVPIIFSETFDNGWDLYPSGISEKVQDEKKYKCNKHCKSRQASTDEVKGYSDANKVSVVSSSYISKNYNGSIQNDNLTKTPLMSLLSKKKLSVEHLYANGYSNLFVVDIKDICDSNPQSCIMNLDGTYDVKMTIFFSPQKNFYIAMAVTAITWATIIIYLLYCGVVWVGSKRNKVNSDII